MPPTDGPLATLRRVLSNRDLRRVLPAYLAFNAAEFGTWVAILLYAYDKTGPASVGLVALVQLVPAAIVAPAAASLGDRYPRQRVLGIGYGVQAVAMLATGAAMLGRCPARRRLRCGRCGRDLARRHPSHTVGAPAVIGPRTGSADRRQRCERRR